MIEKDMRVGSVLFQDALCIAGAAKVGHGLYPGAKRQCMLKTRTTLPKEIFPACEVRTAIFRFESVSRKCWDRPVIIARGMGQLEPIQLPAHQSTDLLRFMLAR